VNSCLNIGNAFEPASKVTAGLTLKHGVKLAPLVW